MAFFAEGQSIMSKGIFLFGCAALSLAMAAPAAADSQGWRFASVEDVGGAGDGVGLYTTDASKPGVAFRCLKGEMFVYVAEEPRNMEDVYDARGKMKSFDATIETGDRDPLTSRVIFVNNLKSNAITDQKTARSLYNAAVRGDTVTLQRDGRDSVTVDLPTADAEAFNAFAEACGL